MFWPRLAIAAVFLAAGSAAIPGATLIPAAGPWRYLAMGTRPAPAGWEASTFSDGDWPEAVGGFSVGYYSYEQAATPLTVSADGGSVRGLLLR